MGFNAAFVQMLGASLFQLSVVAGVPHLIPAADWQLADALIWTPQARPRPAPGGRGAACRRFRQRSREQPIMWCG